MPSNTGLIMTELNVQYSLLL